jgi:hypothetical protein
MITLQQVELLPYDDEFLAVAFLRRSSTVLSSARHEHSVSVHRQIDNGSWQKFGSWHFSADAKVLGFYALEAFYSFLILLGML